MELLSVCQHGTVEDYKRRFEQLMYHIRLYDRNLDETLLVTQFILGLKEELRGTVEVELPNTVSRPAQLALMQEAVCERDKRSTYRGSYHKANVNPRLDTKPDTKPNFQPGEFWKAKQLHEFRRANGLCYKCGDKFAQGHKCATAQVNAMQVDEVLDIIVGNAPQGEMFLSMNAISGTDCSTTIRVCALVKN